MAIIGTILKSPVFTQAIEDIYRFRELWPKKVIKIKLSLSFCDWSFWERLNSFFGLVAVASDAPLEELSDFTSSVIFF